MNKIINFNYLDLGSKQWLMNHCELSDINLKSFHHSKIKNYVMNSLYCTDELSDNEKLVYTFIYDLKAQQKYLPWIYINQWKIAFILWKSTSSISRDINSLIEKNLLIKSKDRFDETMIVPNENINTWAISVDTERLNFLEEKSKHTASSNTLLNKEYKSYLKMKE